MLEREGELCGLGTGIRIETVSSIIDNASYIACLMSIERLGILNCVRERTEYIDIGCI